METLLDVSVTLNWTMYLSTLDLEPSLALCKPTLVQSHNVTTVYHASFSCYHSDLYQSDMNQVICHQTAAG